jgi:DHA1 family tetracycline resistance protein-like MFS transporter
MEDNSTVESNKERKRNILWVFFFVFIDVLGFSLILPLLPFYAKDFQTSPSIIGLMLTFNALTQMISAPIIGNK